MNDRASASKFAFAAAMLFVTGMTLVITQQPPETFQGHPPPLVVIVTLAFTFFHLSRPNAWSIRLADGHLARARGAATREGLDASPCRR